MDICIISYEFPPWIGGEAKYAYNLSKTIYSNGHNVSVIASNIAGRMDPYKEHFKLKYINHFKKTPLKLLSFNNQVKKQLNEMCNTEHIDVVHQTYDYNNIAISKETIKVPIIATIHHPFTSERKFFKNNKNIISYWSYLITRRIYFLEKKQECLCNEVDKIIAVSNYTARSIIEEYDIPKDKIEVIPNGVDINKFNPQISRVEFRKKWNISGPIILYVGRLDYNKGIEYLIKSFSKVVKYIPNAKLVLIGDGPQKNYINKMIDDLNLKKSIKQIIWVNDVDLPKIYASSDVVVLPSLMEGFGIVLLEAMACGIPCIATKAGGVEDVIDNGKTGFIVPPADVDVLYHAIYDLLTDEDLMQRFGVNSRKRVEENFTLQKISNQTLSIYKKMQ